jgi:hypothetical protein
MIDTNNLDECHTMELKAFIVEWRILNKAMIKKNNSDGYRSGKFSKAGVNRANTGHGFNLQTGASGRASGKVSATASVNNFNLGSSASMNRKQSLQSMLNPASVKLDKQEIRMQIKKVLINSIRLKMKLKAQVTSLKNKYYIDEKIILQHLKLPVNNTNIVTNSDNIEGTERTVRDLYNKI